MLLTEMLLTEMLARYKPLDERESAMAERLRQFLLSAGSAALGREMAGQAPDWGHVTASAWVVSADFTRVLLVHHAKLGRWVQPGGHAEDSDSGILAAALREAREETGLDVAVVGGEIFDVDVHAIPEYWSVPEHLHFDVRFLMQADDSAPPVASAESRAARWASLDDAARLNPSPSLARMIAKTRLLAR